MSDYQIEELATEADVLLNNPVFLKVMDDIYSRAAGTLLNAEVGSLTASTAHATMKAINSIEAQLRDYVNERKMRGKFGKGVKDAGS